MDQSHPHFEYLPENLFCPPTLDEIVPLLDSLNDAFAEGYRWNVVADGFDRRHQVFFERDGDIVHPPRRAGRLGNALKKSLRDIGTFSLAVNVVPVARITADDFAPYLISIAKLMNDFWTIGWRQHSDGSVSVSCFNEPMAVPNPPYRAPYCFHAAGQNLGDVFGEILPKALPVVIPPSAAYARHRNRLEA